MSVDALTVSVPQSDDRPLIERKILNCLMCEEIPRLFTVVIHILRDTASWVTRRASGL